MDIGAFESLCKERRSIRKWKNKAVPEEQIIKAIEIGTWAPNGGGKQPYHFYVITNPDIISKVAKAVKEKINMIAELPAARENSNAVDSWKEKALFFAQAPVLVAVTVSIYNSLADSILCDSLDNPEVQKIINSRETASSRVQSAAAAIAQMLLALHEFGLGSVWMTGPVQAKEEIEKILGVPEDQDFIALIPLGYSAEEPKISNHKSIEELITFLR